MNLPSSKLNLGCGMYKKAGYINVDSNPLAVPDVLHDLDQFPYPFPDGQFDRIEADHVLEHLEQPFTAMVEMHRLLKNGGELVVRMPHFSRGFTHADHKRGFDVTFPYYFNPEFKAGYMGATLELRRMHLKWFAQPYLKKTVMSAPAYCIGLTLGGIIDLAANLAPLACSRLWCFWVGGFEEIEFQFICRK